MKNRNFEKLAKAEKDAHSDQFTRAFKDKLIDAWEKMGGQVKVRDWPKYKKDVLGENGKLLGAKGDKFQAHHIIPQQVKGPHQWWNLHPAPAPMHQRILHGRDAKLVEILRNLPKAGQ